MQSCVAHDEHIAGIGHNAAATARCRVEVRLFNSLTRHGKGEPRRHIDLPAGATVGDVARRFDIPHNDIYLVLVNGRDVSRTLGDPVNLDRELEDGDCVALSGPVPFSWGYGAPVV
jgi:hypothetical protein